MANRLNAPNQFETLPPPWLLSQLDTNFTQNQAAWSDSSLGFVNGICTDTGTTNAYQITAGNIPFGSPSALNPGFSVLFTPSNTNTGASTLTIGSLGSGAILTPAGNALLGGEIVKNKTVLITYGNVAPVGFRIVGACPAISAFGSVSSSQTLECAGCTSVVATVTFTSTSGVMNLAHLATGVPVTVQIANNSGTTGTYAIGVTDPTGAGFSHVYSVIAGGSGFVADIISGSFFSLGNGANRIFSGQAAASVLWLT